MTNDSQIVKDPNSILKDTDILSINIKEKLIKDLSGQSYLYEKEKRRLEDLNNKVLRPGYTFASY